LSTPPDTHTTSKGRPLRADAARNREKIVAAAKEAFSEIGLGTQMEDVARRAEVGVGTVYRHFPTKDALVEALIVEKMERLAEAAQSALESDADPWEAFSTLLWQCAEYHLRDKALAQVVAAAPQTAWQNAAEQRTTLGERMGRVLARAQAAGQVRPDVVADDIPLVMCGLGAVVQNQRSWERYMRLVLDGFRSTEADRLPD
jgi:AcrR family transcriptional regulator